MAPKKKYVLSTTVRWSAVEVALFKYIVHITQTNMVENLRSAIRLYAQHLPGFDPKAFDQFTKTQILAAMPDGPDRDRVKMEIQELVSFFEKPEVSDFDHAAPRPTRKSSCNEHDFDL